MMRYVATILSTVFIVLASVSALAHEVIFRGTVVSADAKAIRVTVVDAKTKKPQTLNFRFDKDTKFLRGDKLLSFADAKIQKNERITITTDHDFDEEYAFVVRLDEKK